MSTGTHKGKADRELAAIGSILTALDGLDGESIQRVFDYVLGRMSINRTNHSVISAPIAIASSNQNVPLDASHNARRPSIRDLKDEKKPESSNQMAAIVAFYLSEVAEHAERKDTITPSDLEKYFKQAGFKLPKSIRNALPNAATAGYFDAEGSGHYRLNPVGYNLVVHGLPRGHSQLGFPKKRSKKRSGKK